MVRPTTDLGPVGLILPTIPQQITPRWAAVPPLSTTDGATSNSHQALPVGNQGATTPIEELATLCREAERLGASALWACDHLFWHSPVLEGIVALTVAATATTSATLGTSVVQLPLRQAPAVAKQAASLQQLSQGRLVLGVGIGSHAGEYEQSGVDYAGRGQRLDVGIAALRRAWQSGEGVSRGDVNTGGGARYRQLPLPAPIPVWVGGSSEAAMQRAASLADGWMPLFLSPSKYADCLERLAKEVDRAGRPSDAVTRGMVLFVSIDDEPERGHLRGTQWMGSLYGLPAQSFGRHLVSGTADQVATQVATYQEAGAEHIGVYITSDQPLDQFGRLMDALDVTPVASIQHPPSTLSARG